MASFSFGQKPFLDTPVKIGKTVTLSQDSYLNTGDMKGIGFKAGTVANLNDNGEVMSGTLSQDMFLNTGDMKGIGFKAGTFVSFNSKGKVTGGTLSQNMYLNTGGTNGIGFKSGTFVSFNDKGKVIHGTLSHDIYLNSSGNDISLKAGTLVTFNDNGKVISTKKGEFYLLSGRQIAGYGLHNAELISKNLKLEQRCIIKGIDGNNAGFWIVSEWGNIIKEYYKSNDKSAIGYTLEPGIYRAYPRLREKEKEGSVNITLENK